MREYVSRPASESLRQERFEHIMDNIPAGIMTLSDTGVIQTFNRACADIFGYEPAEVMDKNISMLFPKVDVGAGVAEQAVTVREVEAQRKNGQAFPAELRVAVLRLDDRKAFTCAVQDISERRAAEDDLRRSRDEMEQFAYIASHDLRAPLRGIDNLAQWIGEDLGPVMTPEADKNLKLLRNRVSRIAKLLEDILQYSRAGRVTEEGEKIDTGELLTLLAEHLITDKKFRLEVAPGMPVVVSPRTPLEQVFSNLISNAIKHHDKGEGVILIKTEPRGAYHEFTVADDGPGIPPHLHDDAFKLFQTLKPRDKTEGTGLGLSIVKKLVEWQGGKVWIVSEAGKRGTEVRFLWKKG